MPGFREGLMPEFAGLTGFGEPRPTAPQPAPEEPVSGPFADKGWNVIRLASWAWAGCDLEVPSSAEGAGVVASGAEQAAADGLL